MVNNESKIVKIDDIVREVADKEDVYINSAKGIVKSVFEVMLQHQLAGDEIHIQGFGKFIFKPACGRARKDFKSGDIIVGRDYYQHVFETSYALRDALSEWEVSPEDKIVLEKRKEIKKEENKAAKRKREDAKKKIEENRGE